MIRGLKYTQMLKIECICVYVIDGTIKEKYPQWYVKISYTRIVAMVIATIAFVFLIAYMLTKKKGLFANDDLFFTGVLLSLVPVTIYKLKVAKKYGLDKYKTKEEVETDFPPFVKF